VSPIKERLTHPKKRYVMRMVNGVQSMKKTIKLSKRVLKK